MTGVMEILDLTDELCPLYFCCLEDWSTEMAEAGDNLSPTPPSRLAGSAATPSRPWTTGAPSA